MLPTQFQNLESIREECKAMVTNRAVVSGAAVLIPVPGADIAADVGILMKLLTSVNRKFGLSKEQIDAYDFRIKMLIFSLITKAGSEVIGRAVTKEIILSILKRIGVRVTAKEIAKYIPVIGQFCAVSVSVGAMKYIGNSHVEDCYRIAKQIAGSKELTLNYYEAG
ncbi:MAG: hypothetical protein V2I97_00545 [Desulfococcaceae bacterium]|jgi:uncharacterized protein (DUF697 family)|nr:hypothetical protein [Desulfococcaceae bacterium]